MSLTQLLSLTRRRWAIPLLGDIQRLEGAKFVTLCNRLAANPGAMRQSLDHLIELGFVTRNPGYGHPLRPEYILTRAGERIGPACAAIHDVANDLGVADLCFRRWSLPIVRVLRDERDLRFSLLAERLGAVTDRALALALRDLHGATLVEREVISSSPPSAHYRLTRLSQPLGRALAAL